MLGRQCFGRRAEDEDQEYVRFSYAASNEAIQAGVAKIAEAVGDVERAKAFWASRS